MSVIGPHVGKELELMLQFKKDLALFYTDSEIPEEFFPFIDNGTFKVRSFSLSNDEFGITYFIIFRLEHINKAKELENIIRLSAFRIDIEADRKIGALLGYHPDDIEYFVQHSLKSISNSN